MRRSESTDQERQWFMPLYEHVFLARQDITQQQVTALVKTYQAVLEGLGGKVSKNEYWGLRPISYKIKKNRKAHYTLLNIDAPFEAVAEMERQMRLSSDVIRFLTIKVKELDEKPSAIMKRSDERGERGERGERRGGRREGGFRERERERDRDRDRDREGGGRTARKPEETAESGGEE
jgi:small subunit ribosomal protein S6